MIHLLQNYPITIGGYRTNFRRFQFFRPFAFCALDLFRHLVVFFSPLRQILFAISKSANTHKITKIQKLIGGTKKKPPRKNPEKECFAKPANEPRPAALRRHNPPLTAMLFRCARTYILEVCSWPLKSILYTFQSEQISHDQLPFEGTIRFQLPCCFIVLRNVCFGGL